MRKFSKEKIEKLGNTVIFFADKIPELSKTKLLKLIYLLEEEYIKKYKIPLLDIEFKVWQAGPVNRELFIELSDVPVMLEKYINRVCNGENTIILPRKHFSDDEFSDNELEVMEFIVKNYGHRTAAQLVDITHKPGSPWYIEAERNNLLDLFSNKLGNSSNFRIPLQKFFCSDPISESKYQEQKEFNNFSQHLNQ